MLKLNTKSKIGTFVVTFSFVSLSFLNAQTFINQTDQQSGQNPFDSCAIDFARPTFVDIDNDGDDDIFIGDGNNGYVSFYRNYGTSTNPEFYGNSDASTITNVIVNASPTFVDIDADGDYDAFVGGYGGNSGSLYFFRNVGTSTADSFVAVIDSASNPFSPFNGMFIGPNAAPVFIDLDLDNDFDAVVGSNDGTLAYFQNTGSDSLAVYARLTGANNPFDTIDVGINSAPAFGDIDNDGDVDLIIGNLFGGFKYFENIGTASAYQFVERTGTANPFNSFTGFTNSSPALSDIDGDGDLDLAVGSDDEHGFDDFGTFVPTSNVYFFRNALITSIQSQKITEELSVFPNPSNGVFNFSASLSGKIAVYNQLGQQLFANQVSEVNMIDLSHLSSGIYVLQVLDTKGKIATFKVNKQ